jgi:predicted NAD/FAD-binding protein
MVPRLRGVRGDRARHPVRRIAVIGSGIAGLAAARGLAGHGRVTLYEAADYFGGHAHTVDITLGGWTHAVDTGFLVFNERTYPKLVALLAELGVATAPSEMSFSAQIRSTGIEWSSASLGAVFAQPSNLLRPAFWNMLGEIVRFNHAATALARDSSARGRAALDDSVGDFLIEHRFSKGFRDWYFLPMIGSIWSCPTEQMLRFPLAMLIRFCADHGLLQIAGRPQWRTVRDGARCYVEKMLESIADARLATPVRRVRRLPIGGADVSTDAGTERFDAVVLACHSDQSLALLADPSADEREVLGAIRYQRNRAILHTDTRVLPLRKRAWAAWNYERAPGAGEDEAAVCLHCLINRLQPLPFETPVIVSLNPVEEPDAASLHGEFHYAHPLFDRRAIAGQARLPALQGRADTWFCGAWTGHGSHEDGLASALALCAQMIAHDAAT